MDPKTLQQIKSIEKELKDNKRKTNLSQEEVWELEERLAELQAAAEAAQSAEAAGKAQEIALAAAKARAEATAEASEEAAAEAAAEAVQRPVPTSVPRTRSASSESLSDTVPPASTRPKVGMLVEDALPQCSRERGRRWEQALARWGPVMEQAEALTKAEFGEKAHALSRVSKKAGRKLMLVVSEGPAPQLHGFLVYKRLGAARCFVVIKTAVVPEMRGRGVGDRMLRHAIAMATTEKQIDTVGLSALSGTEPFYERFGLQASTYQTPSERAAAAEGLDVEFAYSRVLKSYMELRVKRVRAAPAA